MSRNTRFIYRSCSSWCIERHILHPMLYDLLCQWHQKEEKYLSLPAFVTEISLNLNEEASIDKREFKGATKVNV